MESSCIITQVNRDEEPLNTFPTTERGNIFMHKNKLQVEFPKFKQLKRHNGNKINANNIA